MVLLARHLFCVAVVVVAVASAAVQAFAARPLSRNGLQAHPPALQPLKPLQAPRAASAQARTLWP